MRINPDPEFFLEIGTLWLIIIIIYDLWGREFKVQIKLENNRVIKCISISSSENSRVTHEICKNNKNVDENKIRT